MTRRHWLDNLRSFAILLLFPVHTGMVWNDYGTRFYIWAGESRLLSTLIVLINPWFMPLLFVVAGIGARYALGRYSPAEFLRRRARRLLLPFLWGTVFLCPVMTLYARKFFFRYDGGLLENWGYFFTHAGDLTGYDGGFTPGHLWFILFLFLISVVTLPLFVKFPWERVVSRLQAIPAPGLLLFALPVWGMYYLGNFGGFSLGKCLALYLAGYYLLGSDVVLERLDGALPWLLGLWGTEAVVSAALYWRFCYYGDLWVCFTGWTAILALLPLGRRYWNRETRTTILLRKVSYPLYLLHQPVLVALAYHIVGWPGSAAVQVPALCVSSFLLTLTLCLLLERLPRLKRILGIQSSSGPAARQRRKRHDRFF